MDDVLKALHDFVIRIAKDESATDAQLDAMTSIAALLLKD